MEKLERVTDKKPVEPNTTKQAFTPVHPGSILKRQLESHGYNTRDLSMLIGSTPEALESIIAEQKAMTDNIAQGLEMVLGVSAGMWMNLQRAYDQAIKSE